MGTETVKLGVTRVFNMFQNKTLNKRLVYVCLEGMIQTLFPHNKFPELFTKLHSHSERSRSNSEAMDSESKSKNRQRKR